MAGTPTDDVIWYFPPDFTQGVKDIWEYSVTSTESIDGSERRMARTIIPDREFQFTCNIGEQFLPQYHKLIKDRGILSMFHPLWHHAVYSASGLTSGDVTIPIAFGHSTYREFLIGSEIVLWENYDKFEKATISSVDYINNIITLTTGLSGNYGLGTQIMPAARGFTTFKSKKLAANYLQVEVTAKVDFPYVTIVNIPDLDPDEIWAQQQYNLPATSTDPNWSPMFGVNEADVLGTERWVQFYDNMRCFGYDYIQGKGSLGYEQSATMLEHDGTRRFLDVHWDSSRYTIDFSAVARNRVEYAGVLGWFLFHRGSTYPFISSTFVEDFRLHSDVLATDTVIQIKPLNHHAFEGQNTLPPYIRLRTPLGRNIYRKVEGFTSQGTYDEITLSDGFGVDFTTSQKYILSQAFPSRFSKDRLTINWKSTQPYACNDLWIEADYSFTELKQIELTGRT